MTRVKIRCKIHDYIFEQTPDNHLHGSGCPKCYQNRKTKTTEEFKRDARKIHGENKFDYLYVIYVKGNTKVIIGCKKHGFFYQTPNSHLSGKGCPICNESKGEKKIREFLLENNIIFEVEKKFNDCKYKNKLRFDFFLPKYNICVEFDGIQHFGKWHILDTDEDLNVRKLRDEIKNEYCKKNNIKLLRIRYNEDIIEVLKRFLEI